MLTNETRLGVVDQLFPQCIILLGNQSNFSPIQLYDLHCSHLDDDEPFGSQSQLDLALSVATLHQTAGQPDLDQGWAWVVLAAAFVSQLIVGGSVFSAGMFSLSSCLYYPQFCSMFLYLVASFRLFYQLYNSCIMA